jgi:hypothetical protein
MEKKMWLTLGATALGCLIVGFGGGFWLGKEKTELEAFHIANMEVAEAKAKYQAKYEAKLAEYDQKLLELTSDNLQKSVEQEDDSTFTRPYSEADVEYSEKVAEAIKDMPRIRSQIQEYTTATEEPPEETPVVKPPVPMTATPVAGPRRERPMVDYRGSFRADKVIEQADEPKATDDPVDPQDAFDISEEQYYDGDSGFQQRQVRWYQPDNVLVNLGGEVFEESYLVVGDTLEQFKEMDEDDNILYVRNPKLKTDLEVIRIHESYAESVQGLMT